MTRTTTACAYVMDEDQAGLLACLLAGYADAAQEIQDRSRMGSVVALLQVARDDLEGLEGALLLVARTASTRTGKTLLTFKKIAAALGVESEQAAQGRYRRKVGNLNGADSGLDGTP
ncbi:hypothetical protein [Streptomyces sp. NPDC056987]|uniref:hypothetical protein n=1 Tax=Streptomyces sp. NPDC056987 TaxID=3345988 RepID=UPI00363CF941